MANTGRSAWSVTPQTLTLLLSTPGVDNVTVSQKGREVTVSGNNDNSGVSYSYTVQLHPSARDTVRYSYYQGLVTISCDNVDSIDMVIAGQVDRLQVPCVVPH